MTAMGIGTAPLSYDDFRALTPEAPGYELVEGQIVVNPEPNFLHQLVVSRLVLELDPVLPSGTVVVPGGDWVLRNEAPAHVRAPDVLVVTYEQVLARTGLREPPLLAVEVLSPDSFERDVVQKRREYAAAGCPYYWIVDPDEPAVVVYALAGDAYSEVGRAVGLEALEVRKPFRVTIVPSALVAPPR